jgi:hypothetical protein
MMANPTVILTFHPDTFELDIDAPELQLDFVMSLIDRAKHALENQEKIVIAHQISAGVRALAENQNRTEKVLSRIKLQ